MEFLTEMVSVDVAREWATCNADKIGAVLIVLVALFKSLIVKSVVGTCKIIAYPFKSAEVGAICKQILEALDQRGVWDGKEGSLLAGGLLFKVDGDWKVQYIKTDGRCFEKMLKPHELKRVNKKLAMVVAGCVEGERLANEQAMLRVIEKARREG